MRAAAEKDFRVVCLGGSAGSLEAYTAILRHMPADTGMAFVIASHRNFEKATLLPQILARVTTMPVGVPVELERNFTLSSIWLLFNWLQMLLSTKRRIVADSLAETSVCIS